MQEQEQNKKNVDDWLKDLSEFTTQTFIIQQARLKVLEEVVLNVVKLDRDIYDKMVSQQIDIDCKTVKLATEKRKAEMEKR